MGSRDKEFLVIAFDPPMKDSLKQKDSDLETRISRTVYDITLAFG